MIKFGLIGDGTISGRHKEAIKHVGGELVWICDPVFVDGPKYFRGMTRCPYQFPESPFPDTFKAVDYVVICSPTKFHREQTKEALAHGCRVICEKPLCLPWEPMIDDDRISVCLQLRYIEDLPKKADLVRAVMVRDKAFFGTWKGDPKQAGGNIYEFFIHYIDLAILLGADFEGSVIPEGRQIREIRWAGQPVTGWMTVVDQYPLALTQSMHTRTDVLPTINILDIMQIDMQDLYNRMYEDILAGGGIKPKDIFYLTWLMNHKSLEYGFRKSGMDDNVVRISRNLL